MDGCSCPASRWYCLAPAGAVHEHRATDWWQSRGGGVPNPRPIRCTRVHDDDQRNRELRLPQSRMQNATLPTTREVVLLELVVPFCLTTVVRHDLSSP